MQKIGDHKRTKNLIFQLTEKKAKTNVYNVLNIEDEENVGEVKWFIGAQRYCYFPRESTVYDKECQFEIGEFLFKLEKAMKKKNTEKKKD